MGNLSFKVTFYDEAEERALKAASPPTALDSVIQHGLQVSDADFWTYALFTEQRSTVGGYRNFAELREKLICYASMIDEQFGQDGEWLYAKMPVPNNDYTEMVGVGAALAVAGAIHQLHEADWQRIPSGSTKSLDFHLASDGRRFVQVEAKGTCVRDPNLKGSQASKVDDIHSKKAAQGADDKAGIFYGSITAYPQGPGHAPVIRLVDPPALAVDMAPRRHRLLARLTYYRNLLLPIYARSPILVALANRIHLLHTLNEWEAWDNMPLLNAAGEEMSYPTDPPASKSATADGRVFGEITALRDGKYMFSGVALDVLSMLCQQSFDRVLTYRTAPTARLVKRDRFRAMLKKQDLPASGTGGPHARFDRATGRYIAMMEGETLVASSGRAFGLLQLAPP